MPGHRLRVLAETWLDPLSLARVIDAPLADAHVAWRAARAEGRAARAFWIGLRANAAVLAGLALHCGSEGAALALRCVSSAALASLVVAGLFWVLALATHTRERRWIEAPLIRPGARPAGPVIERPAPPRPSKPAPPMRGRQGGIGPGPLTPVPGRGGPAAGPSWAPPAILPPGGAVLDVPLETDAVPLVRVPPPYPRAAAIRGIEGYVVVRHWVGPAGDVVRAEVSQAEPEGIFERSALSAVRRWRYRPGRVGERAVERGPFEVLLNFNLEDADR